MVTYWQATPSGFIKPAPGGAAGVAWNGGSCCCDAWAACVYTLPCPSGSGTKALQSLGAHNVGDVVLVDGLPWTLDPATSNAWHFLGVSGAESKWIYVTHPAAVSCPGTDPTISTTWHTVGTWHYSVRGLDVFAYRFDNHPTCVGGCCPLVDVPRCTLVIPDYTALFTPQSCRATSWRLTIVNDSGNVMTTPFRCQASGPVSGGVLQPATSVTTCHSGATFLKDTAADDALCTQCFGGLCNCAAAPCPGIPFTVDCVGILAQTRDTGFLLADNEVWLTSRLSAGVTGVPETYTLTLEVFGPQ